MNTPIILNLFWHSKVFCKCIRPLSIYIILFLFVYRVKGKSENDFVSCFIYLHNKFVLFILKFILLYIQLCKIQNNHFTLLWIESSSSSEILKAHNPVALSLKRVSLLNYHCRLSIIVICYLAYFPGHPFPIEYTLIWMIKILLL